MYKNEVIYNKLSEVIYFLILQKTIIRQKEKKKQTNFGRYFFQNLSKTICNCVYTFSQIGNIIISYILIYPKIHLSLKKSSFVPIIINIIFFTHYGILLKLYIRYSIPCKYY